MHEIEICIPDIMYIVFYSNYHSLKIDMREVVFSFFHPTMFSYIIERNSVQR